MSRLFLLDFSRFIQKARYTQIFAAEKARRFCRQEQSSPSSL